MRYIRFYNALDFRSRPMIARPDTAAALPLAGARFCWMTLRLLIEEKVERRVTALNNMVITELKATEALIRQHVEEMERDNFMRLKRFKAA